MIALETATAGRVGLAQLEPSDGTRLAGLFGRLSPETRYRRFLSPIARLDQLQLERLLDLDHHDREAVAAVVGEEIVGVARYARTAPDTAELAVVVADDWQGEGIGTRLLASLAALARQEGVVRFSVVIQGENHRAVRFLRRFAPNARLRFGEGVVEGDLPLGEEASS